MTYTFKLARRLAILRHFVVLTVLALLVACAKDLTAPDGGSTGSSASSPSVHVLPSSVTVETSQPVRLRGLARTVGGKLQTTQVAWTTSGGTINADGVFSSSLSGTFKVVGRGRGWKNADTSVVIVVPPSPDLVRIAVTPGSTTMDTGGTHTFTATGYLTDGSTAPVGVVWAATGGEVDPSGAYIAGSSAGSYRVIATSTSGSLADTSAVTVTAPAPTLASVIVSPASVSLTPGSSKQFKPYGLNSAGDSVAVTASFTASGGTISSTGLFTAGQTTGSYRVIATSNGLADTAAVSVTAAALPATAGRRPLAAGFWSWHDLPERARAIQRLAPVLVGEHRGRADRDRRAWASIWCWCSPAGRRGLHDQRRLRHREVEDAARHLQCGRDQDGDCRWRRGWHGARQPDAR